MPEAQVEITTRGRGGSIFYREGNNTARFDWEFALPPALALIFGHTAQHWDANYPWAAGRQEEVYNFVAEEVVRQKAPDCGHELDLATGTLTILMVRNARRAAVSAQVKARVLRKSKKSGEGHEGGQVKKLSKRAQAQWVETLAQRGAMTPQDVEALAAIDLPAARAAVEAASKDHLSIDTRLAAAEVMHQQGRLPDLDAFIARQLRLIDRPANGLDRALRLAREHSSDKVKQALLWASYNTTECAPHCAALLLNLTCAAKEPFDDKIQQMLQKLDLHNSYFDRKKAFDELCQFVKMELDTSAAD